MSVRLKFQQHRQLLALALFSLVWLQSLAVSATPGIIKITDATWSGKSVLAVAAQFCDGKNTCSYKVSPQFIGQAWLPTNKSFSITWVCDDAPNKPKTLREAHDATNKVLQLNCPAPAIAPTKPVAAPNKIVIPANLQDPLFPLKYPSSFHSMLMDSGTNAVKNYAGGACTVAVQNHLKQKKSFFSKVMRDRFTIAVKDYPYAQVRDGKLFHHTKSPELLRIARQKSYGELFSFARTKKATMQDEVYTWYFYVAGDPTSSESYGPINMMVTVSPNTLVLQNGGDMPGDSSTHKEANELIEGELIDGDPALVSCKGRDYSSPWYNSMLVMLAAEANGIGLISYFGIDNVFTSSGGNGYQWLQVVGPWAIQGLEQVQ